MVRQDNQNNFCLYWISQNDAAPNSTFNSRQPEVVLETIVPFVDSIIDLARIKSLFILEEKTANNFFGRVRVDQIHYSYGGDLHRAPKKA